MPKSDKLGFWGLTALVLGLMIGSGLYNLPQNMARGASPCAVFMAWMVTAAGILPLVLLFRWLGERYPRYNAGLYQYAQAGFGNYAGFAVAWGYWLCTAFANVAYCVMLNDSFGALYPPLLDHGSATVVFGSVLIWLMYAVVAHGVRLAKTVNTLLAAVKVVMILFIIGIFAIAFKAGLFDASAWSYDPELGSMTDQVKSTMMVTLFCFFGVEGAVMMSARAQRRSDVGRAGMCGFAIALALYLSVSLLGFGLMSRVGLAGLHDPSVAYILRDVVGGWAYWFVIASVIVSLVGGLVAWTLIVAQVPYEAAKVGILPRSFLRLNREGMPAFGLFASSMVMELFLLMVAMADDVYLAALNITGLMIIPCYLFTGLFAWKRADSAAIKALSGVAVIFCLWMAYAGGLSEMMMTSVFYLMGTGFYVKARQGRNRVFTRGEKLVFAVLCLLAAATIVSLIL